MNWKPRIYWALLAAVTALVGWRLTLLITHVDRGVHSTLTVVYEERPVRHLTLTGITLSDLERERFRVPGIVIDGPSNALLIVTPESRSFTVTNLSPKEFSCGSSNRVYKGASPAFLVEAIRHESVKPDLVASAANGGSVIVVPSALHAALSHVEGGEGLISCAATRQLAAEPTFTDRELTVQAQGLSGLFMLDVSALEDINNLRFSGGVAFPFAGERTRFLDRVDNIVSIEWDEVLAEERRDIILVVVGALAAIAAAMAIEAIRPFVEREERS
jgi:hypothetical protein